jgi:hypothetical protein
MARIKWEKKEKRNWMFLFVGETIFIRGETKDFKDANVPSQCPLVLLVKVGLG